MLRSPVEPASPKFEKGRIVTQTVFDLVAYAAPQEAKLAVVSPAAPATPQKN